MVELVEMEASAQGTMVETLRVVEPRDAVEPVRTVIIEWLDERHFRSLEVPGDPALTARLPQDNGAAG